MNWTYAIDTGSMYGPDGQLLGVGYAGGECGRRPEAINNAAFCNVKNVGPLPPGWYTITEWITHPILGPLTGILVPDDDNDMHGRDSFRIHGDTPEPGRASDGCIVLNRVARTTMAASPCQRLRVCERVMPASTPGEQVVCAEAD